MKSPGRGGRVPKPIVFDEVTEAEIVKRIEDADAGRVKSVPFDEAIRRITSELRKRRRRRKAAR